MIFTEPLLSAVDVPCENAPIPNCGFPGGSAMSVTFPVAAAGVTVTVKATSEPCLMLTEPDAGLVIATVSAVKVAVDQAVSRFATLSDPRPVVKS